MTGLPVIERIFTDTNGMVVVECRYHRATTRHRFVYRPDLPEGGYFGDCPRCWKQDRVLKNSGYCFDNGPDVWIICERHKVKWSAGSGLFSHYHDMTKEELLKDQYILSTLHQVDPVHDYRDTAEYIDNIGHNRDPLAFPPEIEPKGNEPHGGKAP